MGDPLKGYHYPKSTGLYITMSLLPLKQKFRLITAIPENWDFDISQCNTT